MADKFVPREQYKTLEKVADEMLATLKAVIGQLQQTQASQSMLIAQLSNYVNKIDSEKNKPEEANGGAKVDETTVEPTTTA
jgi:hypothetical protein